MAKFDLTFDIFGRDKTATSTLRKVGGEADRTNKGLSRLSKVGMAGLAAGAAAAAAGVAVLSTQLVDGVKAAVADQKAQKLLATSLKNTTGATDAQIAATEEWVDATQRATGIVDDDLRPALATLARVTGDVEEAQSLLQTAMDVSAATGKPLETVSVALAKAYTGQTGALSRLGLNMKDSNGKAVDFKTALERLNTQFAGSAAAAADTYDGKMKRLGITFDEFKESVGAKILPALEKFAGWFLNEGVPALERFWAKIEQDVIPTLQAYLMPVVEGVREVLADMGRTVKENQQFFDDLLTIMKPLAAFSAGNFVASIKAVAYGFRVATAVAAEWMRVLRGIRGVADDAATSFTMMWLRFRSTYNQIVRAWNNLSLSWPSFDGDWNGALPGGQFTVGGWTVDTPNIPTLATGGIVTRPTLAMIGEAGPEAVIPLGRAGDPRSRQTVNVYVTQPLGTPEQVGRAVGAALTTGVSRGTMRKMIPGRRYITGLNGGARELLGY